MGYLFRSLPENPFPPMLSGDGTYAVVEPEVWSRANAQIPTTSAPATTATKGDPHGISGLMGYLRYSGSHVSRIEANTKYAEEYAAEQSVHSRLLQTLPASALSFKISALPSFNKKTRADLAFCAIQAFLHSSNRLMIVSSNGSATDTIYLIAERPGKLKSFFTTTDAGKTLLALDPVKIRDVEVALKKVVVHHSDKQSAITRDAVFA